MDAVENHRSYAPQSLAFAVITVSDSRTEATDGGGRTIRELAAVAGHEVTASRIVADDRAEITAALDELLALPCDVVVLTGGTGFAPRDVTVDAVSVRFEREIPGFGELFRALSYEEVGAPAMLSRATAGVVGRRVVYALPGSPKAVRLAMERLILPESGHLLGQLRRPPGARTSRGG